MLTEKIESVLKEVFAVAKRDGKKTGFCIGNTAKVDPNGFYFSPIRDTAQVVAGSIIVFKPHFAEEVARLVDGRVDFLFVDTEKKVGPDWEIYGPQDRGNIERAVRDVVKHSRIFTFKGNDVTVDACDALIAQLVNDPIRGLGNKKVTIIGGGNVGSKLALKLVERGANVTLTRRKAKELETLVAALNDIKPQQTFASVTGSLNNEAATVGADILITSTNGLPVVTETMILSLANGAKIIDAGKGCLFPEALDAAHRREIPVYRVDIRAGFEGEVAKLLETEKILKQGMGRRMVDGVTIVSGGLLGSLGEVIVDHLHHPTSVFGVADGRGDFLRNPNSKQQNDIHTIHQYIEELKK